MKKINKVILGFAMLGTVASCDFAEINKNPNAPVDAYAENVFTRVFIDAIGSVYAGDMGLRNAAVFGGYISSNEYRIGAERPWKEMYNVTNECVRTMKLAKEENNDNLYAAALVMKVFYANKIVNSWGDCPYSEAFRLSGDLIIHPKYDTQKEIYIQQLKELEEAASLFDPSKKGFGKADLLFQGNIDKWQKFANSMRLRLAIRAASGEEAVGVPVLKELGDNMGAHPMMLDNKDNAFWYFSGSPNGQEPWYAQGLHFRDETGYRTSGARAQIDLVEALVNNNDPRTPIYLEKNRAGEYNGWESGIGQTSDPTNKNDSTSAFGDRFCGFADGFVPLYNAAETHFHLAEAALKGYISGGDTRAKEEYVAGITASCKENGVEDAAIAAFLEEPEVKWGSGTTSNFDKICLQRWIVLFKQGIEGWTEVRRTDIPKMYRLDEQFITRHNRTPFRMPFSTEEEALNENFPENPEEIVVDSYYGQRLWWDKREGVY